MTEALVTDATGLERVVAALRADGRVGLDTEFLREKTFRADLCLVQVADGTEIFLVDPSQGLDLSPLADVVADPEVEIVVHAGKQDLVILHEAYGRVPTRIMDVQLAAAFAGLGANLPYGRLVEAVLGVKLVKGESYSDWCRRPLTPEQLSYAADDVRYLVPILDKLLERLDELGRRAWFEEEMLLLEAEEVYDTSLDDAWKRVNGRGTLTGRQMAVLREVARWRDEEASRRNLPRGWIVKDPTLVEVARRMPDSVASLKKIRGMNAREAERSARTLIQAVERGKASDPIPTSAGPGREAQVRARMLAGLADAVVRARCERARIAPELVATRGELEDVLARVATGDLKEERHKLLRGWRRELAGEAVLAVAEGRVAVKAAPKPPYIDEVPL